MKKRLILLSVGFISNFAFAQMTNETIKELKKAGLSDDIIKAKILSEESKFDVSTNGLLDLKNAGFSDEIIGIMIQKNGMQNAYAEKGNSNLVYSIENKHNTLLINNEIEIHKDKEIQINLPANKDFVFIRRKKSGLSAKMLGSIADVVGTGAAAVGFGSNNVGTTLKALDVINTAQAIKYGADALDKINELPISDNAKKIAGKKMIVKDWKFTDDGWIITAEYEKKKYEIYLQEAAMAGEIKLK